MKLKSGHIRETIDNCIRLYTTDEQQFPIIEIYLRLDEFGNVADDDAIIEKMAEKICKIDFDL